MQIGVDTERAVDNRRVFVVDNDEITSAALQFMLHDEIETHELSSLEAAYAKAKDWKPDVLLLGIGIVKERQNAAEIRSRIADQDHWWRIPQPTLWPRTVSRTRQFHPAQTPDHRKIRQKVDAQLGRPVN